MRDDLIKDIADLDIAGLRQLAIDINEKANDVNYYQNNKRLFEIQQQLIEVYLEIIEASKPSLPDDHVQLVKSCWNTVNLLKKKIDGISVESVSRKIKRYYQLIIDSCSSINIPGEYIELWHIFSVACRNLSVGKSIPETKKLAEKALMGLEKVPEEKRDYHIWFDMAGTQFKLAHCMSNQSTSNIEAQIKQILKALKTLDNISINLSIDNNDIKLKFMADCYSHLANSYISLNQWFNVEKFNFKTLETFASISKLDRDDFINVHKAYALFVSHNNSLISSLISEIPTLANYLFVDISFSYPHWEDYLFSIQQNLNSNDTNRLRLMILLCEIVIKNINNDDFPNQNFKQWYQNVGKEFFEKLTKELKEIYHPHTLTSILESSQITTSALVNELMIHKKLLEENQKKITNLEQQNQSLLTRLERIETQLSQKNEASIYQTSHTLLAEKKHTHKDHQHHRDHKHRHHTHRRSHPYEN